MKEKRLGRGLDFLISEDARHEGDEIIELDVESITPNPLQPRQIFDPEALEELAESIKEHGILQPIMVRPSKEGYELIAGERRWRASSLAGRDTISAVVRDVGDEEMLALALVENIHRSDLNLIERAEACRNLILQFKLSQAEAAKRLGSRRSSLSNLLRLLELPEAVRNLVSAGAISFGHAKVIMGLETSAEQIAAARAVVDRGLSVRQLEELLTGGKKSGKKDPEPKPNYVVDLEDRLHTKLGTKVSIQHKGERGKIVIDFYSQDDFERIFEMLEGRP